MSKLFAGAAGNRLAANAIGHRPRAALLLHGGGQTRHAWAKTAHQLADAGWSVVAIDQRGHGDSEWVADGAMPSTTMPPTPLRWRTGSRRSMAKGRSRSAPRSAASPRS